MRNKENIVYALLVSVIIALSSYSLGYSSKHPAVYVYVKYADHNASVIKALNAAGVTLTPKQSVVFAKYLKEGR